MKGVADQVDALNAKLDAAVMSAPGMGELAGLKDKVEGAAQGIMDKLDAAIPSIKFPVTPFDQLPLQDQMKEIAGLLALGYLKKGAVESKIKQLEAKWSNVDVDINNLADLLRSGAMDLDSICKLVPNVDTEGVNAVVKGIPTSFPDIDPVSILRGGPTPQLPKIGDVYIETSVQAKKQTDDFLDIELPTFDW
jgi:hypothetical protein